MHKNIKRVGTEPQTITVYFKKFIEIILHKLWNKTGFPVWYVARCSHKLFHRKLPKILCIPAHKKHWPHCKPMLSLFYIMMLLKPIDNWAWWQFIFQNYYHAKAIWDSIPIKHSSVSYKVIFNILCFVEHIMEKKSSSDLCDLFWQIHLIFLFPTCPFPLLQLHPTIP